MKGFLGSPLALCFLLFLRGIVSAAELSPTYTESVQIAQDHAISPTGWTAPSLFTIPDPAGTEGLTYSGGMLIVRTATKSRNFKTNYVGQAGYKIYGPATTEASWVTTGNDATNFLRAHGATGAPTYDLLERGLGMDATGTHRRYRRVCRGQPSTLLRPTRNPEEHPILPSALRWFGPFREAGGDERHRLRELQGPTMKLEKERLRPIPPSPGPNWDTPSSGATDTPSRTSPG
jgi:hypothetical protein